MRLKVLIADDHDVSRRLLRVTLEAEGYEVVTACDGAEAWAALEADDAPELVLLDWNMPGLGGPDVCRKVRARNDEAYTYMLLLSARGGDDVADGLRSGADDYIMKPFSGRELVERVKVGVRILDMQRRLRTAQHELHELATRDALTALPNRRTIFQRLASECSEARRSGIPMTVALVDLDHFKRINDTRGHRFGDFVLRETAVLMHNALRGGDDIGRFGGEEFLVVLPSCGSAAAVAVAERLRQAVAGGCIDPDDEIVPTVSVGVASTELGNFDPRVLVHTADLALYRAKEAGRNRVEVARCAEPVRPSGPGFAAVRTLLREST